jgi:two-component system NtrC family sensor kinase
MKKATFKIRRKIILAFLFSVLSVLIFAGFSFQVHREIGNRLRLLELTDDLFQNILELRRVEKNFFLYRQASSLKEAKSYAARVRNLYVGHESEILRFKKQAEAPEFHRTLDRYQQILNQIEARIRQEGRGPELGTFFPLEDALRNQGQELLNLAESWEKEERLQIDRLFQRAMYLFVGSVAVFLILGILVAFYVGRLLVRPLFQMQQAMDKIAHGDFTPLPEPQSRCSGPSTA